MIPKIIHFIWIDFKNELNKNTTIPENYLNNIETCRKINLDFEIKIWNGLDCNLLIQKYFPEKLELYNSFKYPIQRCDMARLIILYVYGGIYSDVDRLSLKSYNVILDKYKNYNVILSKYKYYPLLYNDPLISTQNNIFIYQCINNIKKYNTGIMHIDIFYSTGQLLITNQYYLYKDKDIVVLTDEFNPCSVCECSLDIKDSVTFTTCDNNWIDKNSLENLFKIINCKFYLILIILLIIILFIYIFKTNYFIKTKKYRLIY